MAKLALYLVMGDPSVQQVRFRADYAPDAALDTRLYASADQLRATLRQFLGAQPAPKPAPAPAQTRTPRKRERVKPAAAPGLVDARSQGVDQAVLAEPKLRFPVYFPRLRLVQGSYAESGPRTYTIRDEKGDRHRAYRLVLSTGTAGEYYGIQGMTWTDPPILDDPDETRTIAGRRLQLYRDGRAIRLVAFKTRRAVYWVSNSLTSSLTNRQMLATAQSLTRLQRG